MNVSDLKKDGEWLELEAESERIGKLRFKVLPFTADIDMGADLMGNFVKIIADWDLEKDGEKLPCDEANIKEYMPVVAVISTKLEEGTSFVGVEILKFAQNVDNFVKNSRPTSLGMNPGISN